jgi:hypothetical protein
VLDCRPHTVKRQPLCSCALRTTPDLTPHNPQHPPGHIDIFLTVYRACTMAVDTLLHGPALRTPQRSSFPLCKPSPPPPPYTHTLGKSLVTGLYESCSFMELSAQPGLGGDGLLTSLGHLHTCFTVHCTAPSLWKLSSALPNASGAFGFGLIRRSTNLTSLRPRDQAPGTRHSRSP